MAKISNIKYSIIIPVYNAELSLSELYQGLIKALMPLNMPFEIILVDDGSQDRSWDMMIKLAEKDQRVTAMQLLKNAGQGSATIAGMDIACGEFIVTMDDDLQHPPEELPKLIKSLELDERIDVVMGVAEEYQQPFFRRLASRLINRLNNLFLKKDPKIKLSSFRVMRSQVAKALVSMNVYYPSLGPMIVSISSRIKNVKTHHQARSHGKTGYTTRALIKQSLGNIIGYSVLPLHLLALLGMVGVFGCAALTMYFLYCYFFIGISVPGWMTLLMVTMMFSSFNFLAFSLIGEYVLRINLSTTRPKQWVVRSIKKNSEIHTSIHP